MTARPPVLVAVVGTATAVGKTWVAERVLTLLRDGGIRVAARKPVESYSPDDAPQLLDHARLALVTAEDPDAVCPPARRYERPMAPPMAADALGRAPFGLADLLDDLRWPGDAVLGVVETAGGVRSPIAHDGDSLAFVERLAPDLVLLVADAGLGVINLVRLCGAALAGMRFTVLLNRFDPHDDLHRRNAVLLAQADGFDVVCSVEAAAARIVTHLPGAGAGAGTGGPVPPAGGAL